MPSPTPMASSHFASHGGATSRSVLERPALRPQLARHNAGIANQSVLRWDPVRAEASDSSDEEILAPPVFDKATNALLEGMGSIPSGSPVTEAGDAHLATSNHALARSPVYDERGREGGSPGLDASDGRQIPFPRRRIRLSLTPGTSVSRLQSSRGAEKPDMSLARLKAAVPDSGNGLVSTPSANKRVVQLPLSSRHRSGASAGSSGRTSSRTLSEYKVENQSEENVDAGALNPPVVTNNLGSVTRFGTIGRVRPGEETGLPGSTARTRRLGGLQRTFLSGPARRARRRESEEEQDRQVHDDKEAANQYATDENIEPQRHEHGAASHESPHQFTSHDAPEDEPAAISKSTEHMNNPASAIAGVPPNLPYIHHDRKPSAAEHQQARLKVPVLRPDLPSTHDQENEAPPTFKRNKPISKFSLLEKADKADVQSQQQDLPVRHASTTADRPALAPRSLNTPRRTAPAPPKMSVLETATATAGAATASHASRRKPPAMKLNGKTYTRLDILGRGGSSKVFRVMAENGSFYALKRVNLEDADINAIKGFKGEIDLLDKFKGNDRVVNLLDYEMNEEKQVLLVVSESLAGGQG
jgi:serine/threonine-protein kinase TTK/MPS1